MRQLSDISRLISVFNNFNFLMNFNIINVVLVLLLALVKARHPINHDMVNEIRKLTHLWIPHHPEENPLRDFSHEELHFFLGTILTEPTKNYQPHYKVLQVPENFDSRT